MTYIEAIYHDIDFIEEILTDISCLHLLHPNEITKSQRTDLMQKWIIANDNAERATVCREIADILLTSEDPYPEEGPTIMPNGDIITFRSCQLMNAEPWIEHSRALDQIIN